MNDLDQLISRLHRIQDIRTARLVTHIVQKVLDYLIVDIRFQKRKTHLLEHVLHIGIRQSAFSGNVAHCLCHPFT